LHLALSACKTTDDRIKTLLEFLKSLLKTKLPEIKWLETAIKKIYSLGSKITQEELSDRLDIQAGLRRNIFSFFTQCLVGPSVPFGRACPEVVYVLIYLGL
jgi:hypothetical protein